MSNSQNLEIDLSRFAVLGVILGVGAVGACGGASDAVTPPPYTFEVAIVSGDHQSGKTGTALSSPLTIAATTSDGRAVVNATVNWAVTAGGGTLSNASVRTDNQGRASATWTLGAQGNQTVAATVTGIAGSPAINFAAVAIAPPIVLHFDGISWSTALEDVNGARVSLTSIWGTGSAVFAVGNWCGAQLLLQYDGNNWSQLPPTCGVKGPNTYTSVSGTSTSDVFVTLRHNVPVRAGGYLDHFNGQKWDIAVYAPPCPTGILCPSPQAVWSGSPTDVFVAGDSGMIARYDGTSWNQQATGTTLALTAVWGEPLGGAVFAVGTGGTILYYDRSTWRAQPSGTTQPLYAVWGTSANDVFVVGLGGTILHYDGTAWTAQNSGTTQALYGIWGTSGNTVFAVGDGSTILHYDGTVWTAQTIAASMNLRGIWGSSPTNVFAVGAPM